MSVDLPENFFSQELRDGYLVSEKAKKVWAVQLDLLHEFDRVCNENGLCYFLNGGTLLGAVRHHGFIPWDDDIDVMMLRSDYDQLCAIASDVFSSPYFFQTSLTEKGLYRTHAQLRNSNTTGYILPDEKKNINKGIFIDIFVIDGLPDSKIALKIHQKRLSFYKGMLWLAYNQDYERLSLTGKAVYRIYHCILKVIPFEKQFRYFDQKVLAKYSHKNTKMIGDLALRWRDGVHWNREWLSDYVYLSFEGMQFRAPVGYHELLTKQYGDYMQMPDINQRNQNEHGDVFYDPDKPYTYYFSGC